MASADGAARAADAPSVRGILADAWALLPQARRRGVAGLLALMFVGVVLDALGIGLVLPLIGLLVRDGGGLAGRAMEPLLGLFDGIDRGRAVVIAMLAIVAVFVVKCAFRWFLASRQNAFAFAVQGDLSRSLYRSYLRRPWAFHLQRNSATLVQSVAHEVDQYAFGVVLPALVLVAEGLVLGVIAALVVFIEPVGGLCALALLSLCAWFFHRLTTARAAALGGRRRELDRVRFRQLQQGFGAVKETKVLGREAMFVDRFAAATADSARIGRRVQTLRELPRITIELVAVSGLAALVISMVLSGRPLESIVPVVGLFAVAILRVVPSVGRILAAIQSIGLGAASIASLRAELSARIDPDDTAPAARGDASRPAIALEGVSFVYPGAPRPVLAGVDLSIRRGETVGIVGSSGSGKSTLVDLVLGLHAPSAGRLAVFGEDAAPRMRWWQSRIGYVPQAIFLTDDSIRRNIAFGVPDAEIDEARLARAVGSAQLDGFVATLANGLETVVGERGVRLSGGQRQRIGIARALYHEPEVLVLDEATSALDDETERGVMQAIDALHGTRTILVVAHRIGTLAGCDRILRAEGGRVSPVDRAELGL